MPGPNEMISDEEDAENPFHNTLSKASSVIFSPYKRQTGISLHSMALNARYEAMIVSRYLLVSCMLRKWLKLFFVKRECIELFHFY